MDAMATLYKAWPDLVTELGPIDLPSNCFNLKREGGVLNISLNPTACLTFGAEGIPIHMAARFERVGDFFTSFSEMIRLNAIRTRTGDEACLKFEVENMGASISDVADLLTLKGKHTQRAALQLCLQLVFVFRVRTVGQLVIWLMQVLNPDTQLVTDEHTKAMIEAFWHWGTPNFLYLLYEILTYQGVVFSDPALFLYYTKLTTMLEDDAMLTSAKSGVDMRGRLKLPLVHAPVPNIIPPRWLTRFKRLAEDARERMGAELLSEQTEPTLWQSRD